MEIIKVNIVAESPRKEKIKEITEPIAGINNKIEKIRDKAITEIMSRTIKVMTEIK